LRSRRLQAPAASDLLGNPIEGVPTARRLDESLNFSSFAGPLDFREVLDGLDLKKYWNYDGSFTTPPCTEAVDWYVLMAKAPVSQTQLNKFRTAMGWTRAGGNFRNTQPLAGRFIYGCSKLEPNGPTRWASLMNLQPVRVVAVGVALIIPGLVVVLLFQWQQHLEKRIQHLEHEYTPYTEIL